MKNAASKHLRRTTLLIIVLTFYLGCKKNDWYDIKKDASVAVPGTLRDMQALLDNVSVMNNNSVCLGEVGSDGHLVRAGRVPFTDPERNAYAWSIIKPYSNVLDWSGNNYAGAYPKVFQCNIVLEGMPKIIPNGNEEQVQWNNIRGQALFNRARAFYELSQVFAPPYLSSTAETELGIPLRLESDVNIPSKRSTIKETYQQILNDLQIAKELLPAIPLYKTRASKLACYALLSRMYLSMENYTEAGKYADSCLLINNTLMDYNQLDSNLTLPIPVFNPEVIFHARMVNYASTSSPTMLIDDEFYTLYGNDDLRKKIFFTINAASNEVGFKGSYSGSNGAQFSGLATDEIYLIRAESRARAGNVDAAMEDLNKLLRKRYRTGSFIDLKAMNALEALKMVLLERRRELLLRGIRWSDLRRLNRDDRFKILLTRTLDGQNYELEPGSFKYSLPIPIDVIQLTGMPQNLGWVN